MSKRILQVIVLTAFLVMGLGVGVYAHLAGYVNLAGTWVHTSSYEATININVKKFGGESLLFVQGIWTLIETECRNPAGQIVTGEAALQNFVTSDPAPITSLSSAPDKNGRVTVTIKVATTKDELNMPNPNVLCVNPNWTLLDDILVRKFIGTFETQECEASGCAEPPGPPGPSNLFIHYDYNPFGLYPDGNDYNAATTAAYVQIHSCVLPESVQLGDTFPPGQGVPYDCTPVRSAHLD